MTINVEYPESVYYPTGSTQGPFETVFTFDELTDVQVIIRTDDVEGAPLAIDTDFGLTATDPQVEGGSVLLSVGAIPAGGWDPARHALILRRDTPLNQSVVLGGTQALRLDALEAMLDRVVRQGQELRRDLGRTGGGGGGGGGGVGALLAANNLSDLVSKPAARTNLGLGAAATRNVGTAAGTVAAGDDPRFAAQLGAPGLADINDYVSEGDLTYDAAYAACMAANGVVYFPAKPRAITDANNYYRFNATCMIQQGQAVFGDGPGISKVVQNTANAHVFTLGTDIYWFALEGLTIAHDPPTAGTGCGLKQGQGGHNWVDNCRVRDVYAVGNYRGFDLGIHFSGRYINCQANGNAQEGFLATTTGNSIVGTTANGGPLQMIFQDCQAQANGYDGLSYKVTGTAFGGSGLGSSLGTIQNFTTFVNGHHDISCIGTAAHPLHSMRVIGGFMGDAVGAGVYIDSYAENHIIAADYMEGMGTYGVHITANNRDTTVRGGFITGSYYDGILSAGAVGTKIEDLTLLNNGRRGSGGVGYTWAGVRIDGGDAMITNIKAKDTGAVYQTYGVSITGDSVILSGCDLRNNVTAPVIWATGPTNSVAAGCRPSTVNTGGGAGNTVTGNLTVTGNITAGGSITAATDLISNGTTHLNGAVAVNGDINIPTGGIYLTGTAAGQGALVATNCTINKSLGVGTGATGTVGQIATTTLVASSTITANSSIVSSLGNIQAPNGSLSASSLSVTNNISAGGSVTASVNVQAGVDLISLGTLHITGQSAFANHLNITGAGTTIYNNNGSVVVQDIACSRSLGVGTGASTVTGRIDATSIYRAGTPL
ncbi:hypothetical protein [Caulobacter sp. X]|uniref:hypothetical protein n=1 Tax=Caulobacter sp. X TaxID=2048901 RepID=UPI000C15D9E3|nr:hypothetical protein [Caulobacter sp. X]PIB96519.1 hypothetical protein CSW60_18600 [Caulobacter sp. X]